MNRRDFLKSGFGAVAASALAGRVGEVQAAELPAFAKGAEVLPDLFQNAQVRTNAALTGKAASFFIDDVIWVLRDLTRQRPKSIFDNPFLKPLKECHDTYGLKLQLNLFYRTDFFYGMDEFSLADMTDAYKAEWQANADWLKLGFHSLQEFPDYPWINIDYADVKKLFSMIHDQIVRFAGAETFTTALVPHWCPMSKEGCRALKDCGIKLMECSVGPRYRYDGDRNRLPYGHGMRLEQNRKPETAFFFRESRDASIAASICSYNHVSTQQNDKMATSYRYLVDPDTGMAFKHLFGDAPVLNLVDVPTLRADTAKLLGREHMVFSDHEQYFYKDYLAYQPDYAEKIRVMSEMMQADGRRFILLQDLVG